MPAKPNVALYPLAADGSIRNWLASGPAMTPIDHLADHVADSGSPFKKDGRWILNFWAYHPDSIKLKRALYHSKPSPVWQPDAPPALDATALGDSRWQYRLAEDDAMIDFSHFNFTPARMQAAVYAQVHSERDVTISAQVLTIGPFRLWLNNAILCEDNDVLSYVAPMTVRVSMLLRAGVNHLLLHGTMFGWREARLALGLRIGEESQSIQVGIPLGAFDAQAWQETEKKLAQIILPNYAVTELPGEVTLPANAADSLEIDMHTTIPITGSPWSRFGQLQLPDGHAEATLTPGSSAPLPLTDEVAAAMARMPGENSLTLTIRPKNGLPLMRQTKVWASNQTYSDQPYGDYNSRLQEALQHLADMPYDVLAAMAAVETGRAPHIDSGAIDIALSFLRNRHDCADFYAVALLTLLHRYTDQPALRTEDQQRITDTFLNFKFWIDEPGLDGMCYFTENHQILFHVTAYLAGLLWPGHTFANSGLTGAEQQRRAQPRITNWIRRRLLGGYSEWDSNAYLALDVYAMLALAELANSPRLREMATTLLHKTFFMIAAQSYRGTHGSSHGRCYVEALKSARVENTSSLQRIAWGMGLFNGETRATGLLTLARRYRVPEIIQRIGTDTEREVITLARSHAAYRPQFDMHPGSWDVKTITLRTPDGMLSAAVDYRPGEMGVQEHLWQATLGPEAVIFTNYPGNNQLHGHARPNFWAGSVRLPRVVMHQRSLICLYPIAPDVGLGYSHAYFPQSAFDETQISGHWAFARSGDGYIALWGDGPLQLTPQGAHAHQELLSANNGHVWLCHLGRAEADGSFADFIMRVHHRAPERIGHGLRWQTPQGDTLKVVWDEPFQVNDQPVSWDDMPHYHNDYTQTPHGAEQMAITYRDERLKLDLAAGRILS